MARLRVTFFFKSPTGYGWTETLFTQLTDLGLAMTAAKLLLPLRVNLLGLGPSLTFIRVSDDEIKRDSLIFAVPRSDQQSKARSAGDADIANTCLVVRQESGAPFTFRKTLSLRGIPDDVVLDNGQFAPTPDFTVKFLTWGNSIVTQAFAIRVRADNGVPVNITNVSTTGPTGLVTITTAAPHGLAQNDVVNVRQVLGATQVRGLQKVNSVTDATNFVVRINRVGKPYLGAGTVVKNQYQLKSIVNNTVVRCSHRIAGRPFDSPRGRRSVR